MQGMPVKRIQRDFVTLFNCLWYRDFPVTEEHSMANPANWTIHIGLVVRQCATLLGARALFEQGGRTDAVIRFPEQTLAYVEWEWKRAHTDINEFEKLLKRADDAVFQTFIGYTRVNELQMALERIHGVWEHADKPLLVFLVTYEWHGRSRYFKELKTYEFARGRYKHVRSQPALPWLVNRKTYNNVGEDA
jgi:hypothetical protein